MIPQSFGQDIGPQYNFLLMSMLIAYFIPHADFPANNIDILDLGLEGIHHSPMLVEIVCEIAIVLTKSLVEIGQIVIR